ncbi:hypothetical protein [Streptomyces sp. NPDC059874]|uniref:hypothetical protein n=1 Tax=Streptomyces sp. NPDC059874 TaxID=3346983 RepID=UPI0036507053
MAIARHPETAARLRVLEARAGEVTDLAEARDVAAEISRIRNAAATEAGIRTVGGPPGDRGPVGMGVRLPR